jgi:two-component system phosphate regulon response regulator PhoB
MSERILVVDDEKDLLELVQYHLTHAGFRVATAATGEQALERAREKSPDLVLLDILLPDIGGLEVCRILKSDERTKNVPVIFLTAKGEEIDRVVGFELGADDYVTKPFSPRELVLRVRALFKRRRGDSDLRPPLTSGDLRLDRDRHEVTIGKKPVDLTATEFKLLAHLMENAGRALSRDSLLDSVWGTEAFVTDRTIDTHVKRLRAKLGKMGEKVETVRGVGYRFRD